MAEPPKRQPRAGSSADLPRITVDAVVGAGKERAASDDHVRPELARRSQTLNGLGAKQSPAIPPAGSVPTEYAPTRPAPDFDRKRTVRVPTPPSAAIRARRTDPPATSEAPAPEDAPASQPGPSALPPPSQSPHEATDRALRRANAAKDVELDRERRERQKLELELEIERERRKRSDPPAKPWIDERLVKALVGFLAALTALGTPLGIWLTAKATAAEAERERQERSAKEASATASSAKVESAAGAKELDELRKQLAAERAYNRAVLRRMGVSVPKRQGDPDEPQLDVEVPLRKPGTVTNGVVLTVKTPPP